MLASTSEEPFDDPALAFELKWDGYRALALVTSDDTALRSRNGRDLTPAYPDLHDLRRALLCQEAVLDGEVVVLDEKGRPDFNALQNGRGPFTYVVFDLLHVDGEWICDLPWSERRERLAAIVSPDAPPRLMLSDHVAGRGSDLFAAAKAQGLEGVIAKRMDAPYRPGRRVADWRKVKSRPEMVAVVGGFTEGNGSHRGVARGAAGGGARRRGAPALPVARGVRLLERARPGAVGPPARRRRCPSRPFAEPVPEGPGRAALGAARAEVRGELRRAHARRPAARPGLRRPGGRRRGPRPRGRSAAPTGDRAVQEGDRRVTLTNLDKLYWPREGISQGPPARPLPAHGAGAGAPPGGPAR